MEQETRSKATPIDSFNNGDSVTIDINLPQALPTSSKATSGNITVIFKTHRQGRLLGSTPASTPAHSPLSSPQLSPGRPPSVKQPQQLQLEEQSFPEDSPEEEQEHHEDQQQFEFPLFLGWMLGATFLAFVLYAPSTIMSVSKSVHGALNKGMEVLKSFSALAKQSAEDTTPDPGPDLDPEKEESWDTLDTPVNSYKRSYHASSMCQEKTALLMDLEQDLTREGSVPNMSELTLPQPITTGNSLQKNGPLRTVSNASFAVDLSTATDEQTNCEAIRMTSPMTETELFNSSCIRPKEKTRNEEITISLDFNDIGPPPLEQHPETHKRVQLPSIHTIVPDLPSAFLSSFKSPGALKPLGKEGGATLLIDMECETQDVEMSIEKEPSPEKKLTVTTGTQTDTSTKPTESSPTTATSTTSTTTNYTRPNPTHVCRICNNHYATASNLRRHEREHNDLEVRRRFRCKKCMRDFTQASSLKRHNSARHSTRVATSLPLGIPQEANIWTTKVA